MGLAAQQQLDRVVAVTRRRAGVRAALRWQALLLATFTLASQLAGSLHLALVAHDRCAEHGELVDRAGRANAPAGTAMADEAKASLPSLDDRDVAAGHGHDHCLLSPFRRERTSLASAADHAAPLAVPGDAPAARPADRPAAPARIALFRLAPKSSPPA